MTEQLTKERKKTLDNAKKIWAQLVAIKKNDENLAADLEKVKSTKIVPEHLRAVLARRGTTPLAIIQTIPSLETKPLNKKDKPLKTEDK